MMHFWPIKAAKPVSKLHKATIFFQIDEYIAVNTATYNGPEVAQ